MNNPTIKPEVVNNPFRCFAMSIGAIPTSYKDSLDYYEQLLWFIHFLEENVIPVVNNNGEAVTELQNLYLELKDYVIHYLDDKNLQPLINNKLDEMASDGTLENIISKYISEDMLIVVDTVADMIALDLVENQKVKTLGYYSVNDGGNATYKIVENAPSTKYETLDNNLYAELIFNNDINVKMFGAYGDGTHDDTTAIQTAINSVRSYILSKTNTRELDTLSFPTGTYKITDTINLSPLVKIKTLGCVLIDSYATGSALHILPQSTDTEQWFHYNGNYITANDGLFITNKNNSKGSTVGLEISTTDSLGDSFKGFMHATIENITFKDFNTGILTHKRNIYCDNFVGLKFLQTTNNIQWGDSGTAAANSGERITFRNCQFGSLETEIMLLMYNDIADMNFIDCSFDYGNCVLYDAGNKGYSNFNFTQCHFEGISYSMTDTEILNNPYGIVLGDFIYSNINFNQCNIGIPHRRLMFHYGNGSAPVYAKYRLNIIDCEVGTADVEYDYNKIFWIEETVNAYVRNTSNHMLKTYFPNIKNNILDNPYFDTASTGTVTVTENSTVGGMKITTNPGFADSGEIITNAVTGKNCLKVKAKVNNPSIQILSEKFDVIPGDKLNVAAMTKNFYTYRVNITYYDVDDNVITSAERSPYYAEHPDKTVDSINAYTVQDYAPYRARKAAVRIIFSNAGQTDTVLVDDYCYIDGIFCYKN